MREELDEEPQLPLGVRLFRRIAHVQYAKAMFQLERIRSALREGGGGITTLASHDTAACERLCGDIL